MEFPSEELEDLQTIPIVTRVKRLGSWQDSARALLLTRPALEEKMDGKHKSLSPPNYTGKHPPSIEGIWNGKHIQYKVSFVFALVVSVSIQGQSISLQMASNTREESNLSVGRT